MPASSRARLADVLAGAGQGDLALPRYAEAMALARRIGARHTVARAHDSLAAAYHAAGDHGRARQHWQQALARYAGLGMPEAGQIRARLSALPPLPREGG
jgi:hypothetical protein